MSWEYPQSANIACVINSSFKGKPLNMASLLEACNLYVCQYISFFYVFHKSYPPMFIYVNGFKIFSLNFPLKGINDLFSLFLRVFVSYQYVGSVL